MRARFQESRSATETITNVALLPAPGDNQCVRKKSSGRDKPAKSCDPFLPGSLVIVTLGSPREKFWGMILTLAPAGLSLSGVELASLEDLAVMVKEGEPFTPAVVFFPMHRVERVELDSPNGSLPSLSERFYAKTGLQPSSALAPPLALQGLASIQRAPRERA
jgi:hypothetical protein